MTALTVSHSELRAFLTCPTLHRFRYVLQRESTGPAPEALSKGRQVDQTCALLEAPCRVAYEPNLSDLSPDIRALVRAWGAYWPDGQFLAEEHHVKFRFELQPELELIGEFDALGTYQGRRVILERKSSSEDISPGSSYWQRVELSDAQVSLYLLAAERLGLGVTEVLYDVLRKPALRLKKGETPEAFEQRCLEAISEDPEHYFQRKIVTRLEPERAAHVRDVHGTVRLMQAAAFLGEETPRNTGACWQFGRPCEFFAVCGLGASIDDPELFRAREGSRIRTEATTAPTLAPPPEPEKLQNMLFVGPPQQVPCAVCGSGVVYDQIGAVRTWLGPGRTGWRHAECSPLGLVEAGLVESADASGVSDRPTVAEADEPIPFWPVVEATERKRRFSF